ncbi:MAG: hypothetical protein PHQ81_05380 [Methanofollis sp.]|nr:hypothetical protein [Methanofollis sp.]
MERRTAIRAFIILLALLLVGVTLVPVMSASDEKGESSITIGIDVPEPEPTVVPSDETLQSLREKDDGVIIDDTITYLTYWNERMKWDLSEEEIKRCSQNLEENILVRYYDADHDSYHINDLDAFGEALGPALGLNNEQTVAFVQTHREQLVIDHQNYHLPPRW